MVTLVTYNKLHTRIRDMVYLNVSTWFNQSGITILHNETRDTISVDPVKFEWYVLVDSGSPKTSFGTYHTRIIIKRLVLPRYNSGLIDDLKLKKSDRNDA